MAVGLNFLCSMPLSLEGGRFKVLMLFLSSLDWISAPDGEPTELVLSLIFVDVEPEKLDNTESVRAAIGVSERTLTTSAERFSTEQPFIGDALFGHAAIGAGCDVLRPPPLLRLIFLLS